MSRQFKVPVNLVSLLEDPTTATVGDIYYNSVNSKIRVYTASGWVNIGSGESGGGTVNHSHDYDGNVIVGAGGSIVTTATFGSGIPNNANGQDGDVYFDITNLNLYTKSAGTWSSPTEINVYTKTEIDNLLSAKADSSHTHQISDVTDITASAAELNILEGVTVSATEINYLSGLVDNVQDQLDNVGNSLGDYIPTSAIGQADGVAATDPDNRILVSANGIKFSDNTIQTTAFNTSGFATAAQLSDVEVLALAAL